MPDACFLSFLFYFAGVEIFLTVSLGLRDEDGLLIFYLLVITGRLNLFDPVSHSLPTQFVNANIHSAFTNRGESEWHCQPESRICRQWTPSRLLFSLKTDLAAYVSFRWHSHSLTQARPSSFNLLFVEELEGQKLTQRRSWDRRFVSYILLIHACLSFRWVNFCCLCPCPSFRNLLEKKISELGQALAIRFVFR